ncbi:MAG TPA: hypothetical protein VM509_08610 [Planctomycetota bacterium]|nr:hypothetical protein [Planctomycetota bacterium]
MFFASLALACLQAPEAPPPAAATPSRAALIADAVQQLVAMQEDGEWPYEGVYRVKGEIPVGYHVGGTSIVATTLLHAAPKDEAVLEAIALALDSVSKNLAHPLMEPSTVDAYDVRVWGHAYALAFLCELRAAKALGSREADATAWIGKLLATLATEEIPGGGWNYANRKQPATFVTAPVIQALLLARSQGEKIPDELFERGRDVLLRGRHGDGAFVYSGGSKEPGGLGMSGEVFASLAGASGRSAACESTLFLLGASSLDKVRGAALNFFDHWDDLEARRKKTGTHEGPYRIAPYYFYYAHAYTAQSIELLPSKARDELRARMLETLLKTRDADGTWDDRVFPRTRNYGTSMAVLALLLDKAPMPPAWSSSKDKKTPQGPAGK